MEAESAPRTLLSEEVTQAILEWDVRTWSHALRFWHDRLPSLSGSRALEIGSRRGGLSLFMAILGARVSCTDLAPPPASARELHVRFGIQDHVHYLAADATRLPFADRSLDLVMAKSVLGGIGAHGRLDRQCAAVAEVHRVLRPGGLFCLAENLEATVVHRFLRRHAVPWGRRWRYPAVAELEDILASFSQSRAPELRFSRDARPHRISASCPEPSR